jgi:hypothetical protein
MPPSSRQKAAAAEWFRNASTRVTPPTAAARGGARRTHSSGAVVSNLKVVPPMLASYLVVARRSSSHALGVQNDVTAQGSHSLAQLASSCSRWIRSASARVMPAVRSLDGVVLAQRRSGSTSLQSNGHVP